MGSISDYSRKCGAYFDGEYSQDESYWGDQPNLLVPLVSSLLKPHSRALVVGCGEGRDALFLARIGFDVVATEISEQGIRRAREAIKEDDFKLQLLRLDAHLRHDHLGRFDAILIMNVLQFLDPEKIPERIVHFRSMLNPGGIISIQVFTFEDPEYQQQLQNGKISLGTRTLTHPERGYTLRIFERGELASYFQGWEMIYYHEGLTWDKPHGTQTDFHQHGMAQMIARKPL
jgi:tellurite methyltransferase